MNTAIVGFIALAVGVILMVISPMTFTGLLITGCIVMVCGWVLAVIGVAKLGAGEELPEPLCPPQRRE